VRLLIARGGAATVQAVERTESCTLLHFAVLREQEVMEVVRCLINSGADVNAETNDKMTPLMLAQELPVVRLLLESGAAVNAKSSNGTTALHKAAKLGLSAGVVCCLLKAGADATAVNSEGHEPAAVAVMHGHTATAALLQRAAADQWSKCLKEGTTKVSLVPLFTVHQFLQYNSFKQTGSNSSSHDSTASSYNTTTPSAAIRSLLAVAGVHLCEGYCNANNF
jgi:ankyrin repeat protein